MVGAVVGAVVGLVVGAAVAGALVGFVVGAAVAGALVGLVVGAAVAGALVGFVVGAAVAGALVGLVVGAAVAGALVGLVVGAWVVAGAPPANQVNVMKYSQQKGHTWNESNARNIDYTGAGNVGLDGNARNLSRAWHSECGHWDRNETPLAIGDRNRECCSVSNDGGGGTSSVNLNRDRAGGNSVSTSVHVKLNSVVGSELEWELSVQVDTSVLLSVKHDRSRSFLRSKIEVAK